MATSQPNLRVKISADLADIKQGLGLLRGELAKVKQQSAQAFGGAESFTKSLAGARNAIKGLFAGVTVGALFAGIVQNTREAEDALGQLRAGLKSTGGIAGVTEGEIVALAESLQKVTTFGDDTIIHMSSVVATFTNIRGAIFKEAIPAILDLSVRLGTDLNSAAIQVGKALNDPIKGITALGRAGVQFSPVQKEMIKTLVETGKVQEAQKIILGELSKQMGGSAAAAADTFAGSLEQAKNAAGDLLEGDSSNGGLKDAKTAVQELTAVMQDAQTKQAFAQLLQMAGQAAQVLVKGLSAAVPVVRLVIQNLDALAVLIGSRLALSAIPAMLTGVKSLQAAFIALRGAALSWSAVAAAMGGPIGLALAALATALYVVYQRTNDAKRAAEEHEKALAANAKTAEVSAEAALEDARAKRAQAVETIKAAKAALEAARAQSALSNQQMGRSASGSSEASRSLQFAAGANAGRVTSAEAQLLAAEKEYKDWGDRLAELATQMQMPLEAPAIAASTSYDLADKKAKKAKDSVKALAASVKLEMDQVKRELDALEQLYADGVVGVAAYYGRKQELQLRDNDLQLQQSRNELAITTDLGRRRDLEEQIAILLRDRGEIGPRVARDQKLAEKELTDQLELLRGKLADLQGGFGNEAGARLQDEYEALLKKLGDSAEAKDIAGKIFNIESAKARIDAIRGEAQKVIDNLRSGTDYINSQRQLGALGGLGPGDAERQLQALRAASIDQLQRYKVAMQEAVAAAAPGTPQHAAALQGLAEINTALADTMAAQHKFRNEIADRATGALGGFFDDLIEGAKSFKQAFTDMVRNFLSGVAKMIAQELALRAIKTAMRMFGFADGGAFGPGGAKAFAKGAAFALPGLMAFANGGAFTNSIVDSPTLFAFGQGGQFGVMGEAGPEAVMPLERGSDGKLGVRNNGGGAPAQPAKVVVVFSEAELANAMAGSAGESVTIAHVRNNWGGLNGVG